MRDETVIYDADGVTLKSRLFYEEHGEPRPAVLVFPEAFGLSEHALSRAQSLAAMGYVSLACDIHGDARLVAELNEAVGLLKPLYDDSAAALKTHNWDEALLNLQAAEATTQKIEASVGH